MCRHPLWLHQPAKIEQVCQGLVCNGKLFNLFNKVKQFTLPAKRMGILQKSSMPGFCFFQQGLMFYHPELIFPFFMAKGVFFELDMNFIQFLPAQFLFQVGKEFSFLKADMLIDQVAKE